MKNMKRIHSIKINRMMDESPDTSWLGEYSDRATSEYSIDRAHSEDCRSQFGQQEYVVQLYNTDGEEDGAGVFIDRARAEKYLAFHAVGGYTGEITEQDAECDCGSSGDMPGREYRYFNPSFNYVDKNGAALPENTPEEVRKYVQQDYERMESLSRGSWGFIGIEAVAVYSVGGTPTTLQTITSGGVWGVESDGDYSDVESDRLAELKDRLTGIGFSKRAISAAFKNVEHED